MATEARTRPIRVVERSIYSAFHCFARGLREKGEMEDDQFQVLKAGFELALKQFPQLKPDVIVYLRSSPATVFERMQIRGRNEEGRVQLKDLTEIHNLHESWLCNGSESACEVIQIDANLSAAEVVKEFESKLSSLFA